jgi:hypothetical protein
VGLHSSHYPSNSLLFTGFDMRSMSGVVDKTEAAVVDIGKVRRAAVLELVAKGFLKGRFHKGNLSGLEPCGGNSLLESVGMKDTIMISRYASAGSNRGTKNSRFLPIVNETSKDESTGIP